MKKIQSDISLVKVRDAVAIGNLANKKTRDRLIKAIDNFEKQKIKLVPPDEVYGQ